MKKIILSIEGMTCSACSNGLEKYLKKQDGILDVSVNLVMATASIEYEDRLSIKDLEKYILEAGFKSLGKADFSKEDKKKGKTVIDKQFEYNTYTRDFFADNKGKSLEDAIKCWKYKKQLQGNNRYEKSDLVALD